MIGWMDNWQYAAQQPTSPWRGQMTLPRKLSLHETADGIRLFQAPVDEMQQLAQAKMDVSGSTDSQLNVQFAKTQLNRNHTYQLLSTVDLGKAAEAGWKVLAHDGTYTLVGYDKQKGVVYVDRTHSGTVQLNNDFPARTEAPLKLSGPLNLDLVIDRDSVELFANRGSITMTNLVFPNPGATTIEFYSKGGRTGKVSAHLTELKSAH
jgi:sucrose-6-phosphate hydrolase SacC (GH32 family)